MAKKVSHIELHDGFFIPQLTADVGGGQFGKSIPSAGKTLVDLEMILNDNGSVEVSFGKGNFRTTLTIGAANIKYAKHAVSTAATKVIQANTLAKSE